MNFKIDRRKFISSTGLVLILPALEELLPKAFAQSPDPRRFVTFYFPNGTYNQRYGNFLPPWCAAANGPLTDNVGAAFTPFLQHKADFSVINNWKWKEATDHQSAPLLYLSNDTGIYKSSIKAGESTFDHMHAAATGKAPIILYGGTIRHDGWKFMSYKNGVETLGMTNPGDLYRQLLAAIAPQAATVSSFSIQPQAATGNLAKSILDNSVTDIQDLQRKLGRTSRTRLDQFLTAVRELEARLGLPVSSPSPAPSPTPEPGPMPSPMPGPMPDPNPSVSCARPGPLAAGVDTGKDPGSSTMAYFDRFRAFNDLIQIAFACDTTRTVTIMFDRETAERVLSAPTELVYRNGQIAGLGAHTGGIAHNLVYPNPSDVAIDRNVTRDRVLLSLVFDLVTKLKGTKDASGSSVLDNTIIYGGHGCEHGNHANMSYNDAAVGNPAFIAGGRNFMTTGLGIDGKQFKRADLLYTFNTLLGMGLSSFGGSSKKVAL